MNKQLVISLAVWLALLALPFALRPKAKDGGNIFSGEPTDKLVIISAHNKATCDEYARAFGEYYDKKYGKYGRRIELDFRNVGGTSAISKYLSDRFEAEFRAYYEKKHPGEWDDEVAKAFADGKIDPKKNPKVPEKLLRARKEFLESNVGVGIDIMAGGGTYEHSRNARNGYAVDAGIKVPDSIPERFGGDTIYDRNGRYYGVVLSTFGICCNLDRIRELGGRRPERWSDLGDPRFIRTLAVADPTKSGSANKCFEIVLQQAMSDRLKAEFRAYYEKKYPGEWDGKIAKAFADDNIDPNDPKVPEKIRRARKAFLESNADIRRAFEKGWAPGLNLIKRIFANARNISDSASKVVRDVCEGDAAAGMAIDTHGISEEFWSAKVFDGEPHCVYVTPKGGTAVSVDPVQMLRGAPNRAAAKEFIEFLLSEDGQKLHCFKTMKETGLEVGPEKASLNRPPVRKDLYTEANLKFFFKPGYNPYESGADFTYHREWTQEYFNLLRVLFKSIAIDPHDELVVAWRAICEAGGPERVPLAMAEFEWLPFDYAGAKEALGKLKKGTPADIAKLTRKWSDEAREHYKNAARLAREGK